jgi:hypothetical protein
MQWSLREISKEKKNDSLDESVVPEEAECIQAENEFMQIAIEEALQGITHQHGGPFGSVVVKDRKWSDKDITGCC